MKILIVDDNQTILNYVVCEVEELGHETVVAMSGSEAFRKVHIAGPFDAIITDMQMKWGTGLELIEMLSLESREIPCRLQSSEDSYMKGGEHIDLTEAVKKYPFASFALKTAFGHIEKFLSEVEERKKT